MKGGPSIKQTALEHFDIALERLTSTRGENNYDVAAVYKIVGGVHLDMDNLAPALSAWGRNYEINVEPLGRTSGPGCSKNGAE